MIKELTMTTTTTNYNDAIINASRLEGDTVYLDINKTPINEIYSNSSGATGFELVKNDDGSWTDETDNWGDDEILEALNMQEFPEKYDFFTGDDEVLVYNVLRSKYGVFPNDVKFEI